MANVYGARANGYWNTEPPTEIEPLYLNGVRRTVRDYIDFGASPMVQYDNIIVARLPAFCPILDWRVSCQTTLGSECRFQWVSFYNVSGGLHNVFSDAFDGNRLTQGSFVRLGDIPDGIGSHPNNHFQYPTTVALRIVEGTVNIGRIHYQLEYVEEGPASASATVVNADGHNHDDDDEDDD